MNIDELCYKVIRAAMAVHRHFGAGYLEEVYKNSEEPNRLILELKAVTALCNAHEAQLVNYLNATGIDDSLLINFGSSSLQHKHKYRIYRSAEIPKTLNPVNPVNPV